MPKVIMNEALKAYRGKIGDLVYRQMPDGSVIVSRAPHRRKNRVTQKQKDHWSHFQKCTEYGRWAAKVYPIYAELAKGTKLTAYNVAVSDFYHPPVIHRIERGEGCIRVQATDNIMVTRVRVTVLDEQGTVLEKGEAIRVEGDWWEFPYHAEGKKIIAEAWDLPGNVGAFTAPSCLPQIGTADLE